MSSVQGGPRCLRGPSVFPDAKHSFSPLGLKTFGAYVKGIDPKYWLRISEGKDSGNPSRSLLGFAGVFFNERVDSNPRQK